MGVAWKIETAVGTAAGETLVNGHAIAELVEVPYPVVVQAGTVTLVVSHRSRTTKTNDAPLEGKCTLVEEIARGGMGRIHLGDDPQIKRQVAVKVRTLAQEWEHPRLAKEAAKECVLCSGEPGVGEALQLTRELVAMPGKERVKARLYAAFLKGGRYGKSVA